MKEVKLTKTACSGWAHDMSEGGSLKEFFGFALKFRALKEFRCTFAPSRLRVACAVVRVAFVVSRVSVRTLPARFRGGLWCGGRTGNDRAPTAERVLVQREAQRTVCTRVLATAIRIAQDAVGEKHDCVGEKYERKLLIRFLEPKTNSE